jgi:hypothetical protein
MDTREYSLLHVNISLLHIDTCPLHVNTLSITGKYILPECMETMENGQTLVRYQSNRG